MVIDPGNFPDPPTAATALLKPDESAVKHFVGGGQNLVIREANAGLLRTAGFPGPRLVVIVLFAGNLERDDGVFPRGRLGSFSFLGLARNHGREKEQNEREQTIHIRRSFEMP